MAGQLSEKYSESEYIFQFYLLIVEKNVSSSRPGVKFTRSKAFIKLLSSFFSWNMKQELYNVIKNTVTGNTWYFLTQLLRLCFDICW